MNLVHPNPLNESANRLLYPLLGKNPPGKRPFLPDIPRVMFMEKNILLKLRRTSSVRGIGKRLLARNLAALADRTFPRESLSPIRFPTTVVTRGKETTTNRMVLRMKPTSLPPRKRRLSSPDSPGKGESVSCHSLFPRRFQFVRRKNQRNGPTKT